MLRSLLVALLAVQAGAQTVRVGVLTLFHPQQLQVEPVGPTALVLTSGGHSIILNGEPGHRQAIARLANGHLLFAAEPSQAIHVAARDGSAADFLLAIPGKITRRYHGVLDLSSDPKQLLAVVSMDIETATASVVAAESPPGASIEALKAQAIVARSFFHAGPRHRNYDFCDTTHCQFLREPPPLQSPASVATRATQGLILTWHGLPLAPMYSSRCGGRTKSLREIGIASDGYPYFPVDCAYCRRHPVKWSRTLSSAQAAKLARSGEDQRLALGRQYGWSAVPGNHYSSRTVAAGVILSGRGAGHGVGLCQYGSAGMAAEGASFDAILRHYYPETELRSISPDSKTQP